MPSGLMGRMLLLVIAPIVLSQVIASFLFLDYHWSQVQNRLAKTTANSLKVVIDILPELPSSEQKKLMLSLMGQALDMEFKLYPGRKLEQRYRSQKNYIKDFALKDLKSYVEEFNMPYYFRYSISAETVDVMIETSLGLLVAKINHKQIFSTTVYFLIFGLIGVVLLLSAIIFPFVKNQVRGIKRLAEAAENFGRDMDMKNFKPEGASEVRAASRAFIIMRDRIKRQIASRTDMLSGISHDLRTPLTRMKLELELDKHNPLHDDLLEDLNEMERMINSYLEFARGEGAEAAKLFSITKLLRDCVKKFANYGAKITFREKNSYDFFGRSHALKRCFSNILSNAVKYAKQVNISIVPGNKNIDIIFDDDGPGIPVNRRADMFKPFVRLDNSRNSKTGGVGLGLSIAKEIVNSHGGKILLEDSPKKGLRVRISLPL